MALSGTNRLHRVASLEFVPSSPPTEGKPVAPVTAAGTKSLTSSLVLALVAIAAVFAASAIAVRLWRDTGFAGASPAKPVEGLTIFGVFFVAATALERLLEPLASLLGNQTKKEAATAKEAAQKKTDLAGAVPGALNLRADAQAAAKDAADAQATDEVAVNNRKILFWALASILGIGASSSMKLYLLTTTGIAAPSRWMEVLATGLIVGGGTKPLHDLVELISAKKDAAKAAGA